MRNGVDYLVAGGAIAIVILIAASPFILLGVLAWLLLRTRRRRIDDRLLAEPRPAGRRTLPLLRVAAPCGATGTKPARSSVSHACGFPR